MKIKPNKYIYILLQLSLFLALALPVEAQENPAPDIADKAMFDSAYVNVRYPEKETLARFYNDKDFLYDREPPAPVTLWDKLKFWIIKNIIGIIFAKSTAPLWKTAFYLVFAFVLIFIIARLLKTNIQSLFYKPEAGSLIEIETPRENIKKSDFDRLISEKIKQKQYRAAVRLLYLKTLKELANKNMIRWKIDKTNIDYFKELQDSQIKKHFEEATLLYEYVWYGNFLLDEELFQRAYKVFKNFNQKLVAGI